MSQAQSPSPQGNPDPPTTPAGAPATRWARLLQPLGLLLGSVLGLLSASQAWWRVVAGQGDPTSISGNDASGGLAYVLPLVALAGWLLALSLRGIGRRIVAVLLMLTGAGMIAAGVPRRPPESVIEKAGQPLGLDPVTSVTATAWPYVFCVAGALVTLGAVAAFVVGGARARRASRFERTTNAGAVTASDDPSQIWKALDQGVDPTEESGRGRADTDRGPGTTHRD